MSFRRAQNRKGGATARPAPSTRLAAAVALALLLPGAEAANWFVEAGVRGELTATTNANLERADRAEEDLLFAVTPTLTIRGEGRRLRVAGTVALTGVTYVNGAADSALVPLGSIEATLEAIERWFFIEAGVAASRSLDNPLGPRPDGASTVNRLNTTTTRLSPYIDRALPNDIRLLIRSDNSWTRSGSGSLERDSVYAARHSFSLSREPQPFGWGLEATRTDERSESGTDRVPSIDVARLRLRYAPSEQFAIGARGGIERSDVYADRGSLGFAGAELAWRPTERTRLEGFWEDRSFGSGWQAGFTHRSPFVAWDARASRDLTSFAGAAIELPATGDLAALLDAALRTRIADPIERARAVEDFIARRGLPRSLNAPINLFSDQLVIRTAQSATITLIGTRSTLALTVFYQRDESPTGSSFAVLTGPLTDLRQRGGSLAYSLRLSSRASVLASAALSRSEGDTGTSTAAPLSGESRQQTYRLQYDYQLAPRSTGFIGVRRQLFRSDTLSDSNETAVFTGLGHRF